MHLRWATGELHTVEKVDVQGQAKIRVAEVSLTHHRLGEVVYAYGEATVGDQKALIVMTEAAEEAGGGKMTVRFRPDPSAENDSAPPS